MPQFQAALMLGIEADTPAEAAYMFSELLSQQGVRNVVLRVQEVGDPETVLYFDGYGEPVAVDVDDKTG